MLITIDKDVFKILKKVFGDKPLSADYVSATDGVKVDTPSGNVSEVIRLPILKSEVEHAESFLVVFYDRVKTENMEAEAIRCDTLAEAVNLMVNNPDDHYFREICVDDGEQAIYDVMRCAGN